MQQDLYYTKGIIVPGPLCRLERFNLTLSADEFSPLYAEHKEARSTARCHDTAALDPRTGKCTGCKKGQVAAPVVQYEAIDPANFRPVFAGSQMLIIEEEEAPPPAQQQQQVVEEEEAGDDDGPPPPPDDAALRAYEMLQLNPNRDPLEALGSQQAMDAAMRAGKKRRHT